MKKLSEVIAVGLQQKGVDIDVLVNEIDIKRSTYYYVLKSENLKLKNLDKLFKYLNIEPNYFFDYKPNESVESFNEEQIQYGNDTKKDTVNVSLSETAFLRNKITDLIAIISDLTARIDTDSIN